MRSSENLNFEVLGGPTPGAWGGEVFAPESIVQLLWVAAASREVGRFARVVYKEERDMNEREKS